MIHFNTQRIATMLALMVLSWLNMFMNVLSETERNDIWYLCPIDTGDCDDIDCTLSQGAQRAGYTCDEFPWYSGGFAPSDWDDEEESYTCQTPATDFNGTEFACSYWDANEFSISGVEFGDCQCFNYTNNNYCDTWVCYQVEGNAIDISWEICDRTINVNGNNEVYSGYCPISDNNIELLNCWCISAGSVGLYCKQWVCYQYDVISSTSESIFVETEIYRCNEESSNGYYCNIWDGDITSDDSFELIECECEEESISQLYCSEWQCYEKEMPYLINTSNFFTSVLISCIGSFILLSIPIIPNKKCKKQCNPHNRRCTFCTIFFTFIIFGLISLFIGGIAALIIWFIVWILSFQLFWIYLPSQPKNCLAYDQTFGCTCFGICDSSNDDNNQDNNNEVEMEPGSPNINSGVHVYNHNGPPGDIRNSKHSAASELAQFSPNYEQQEQQNGYALQNNYSNNNNNVYIDNPSAPAAPVAYSMPNQAQHGYEAGQGEGSGVEAGVRVGGSNPYY